MSGTDSLVPGYVIQGMASVRAGLWTCAAKVSEKSRIAGNITTVPVYVLSKSTEYLQCPLQTVENIGLTAINLVGATFSKGCRNNLDYCRVRLVSDLFDTWVSLIVAANVALGQVFFSMFAAYHALKLSMHLQQNNHQRLDQQANYHMAQFVRIQAIRLHGYENIKKCDSLFPNTNLGLYKLLLDVPKDQFDEFYTNLKAEFEKNKTENASSIPLQPWECPEDLKADNSALAETIKHILKTSHGVELNKMTTQERKEYLCKLLELPITDATDRNIKLKKVALLLKLHPDKAGEVLGKHATTATQLLNQALQAYEKK